LRSLPFIALVPVSVRLFGTAETGKVLLICWATCSFCWPVVDSAARAIPQAVTGRALTLGALPMDRLRVVWLETRAGIFSALRASLALAWIVVATVEMAGVFQRSDGNFWSEGLGYRLFRAQEEGQDGLLLGMLLVFSLTGAGGELLLWTLWQNGLKLSLRWRIRRVLRDFPQIGPDHADRLVPVTSVGRLMVQDLQASYAGTQIFSGCSLDLQPGEILTVLGRSGAGKTTLLRCIAQLLGDDLQMSGTVLLDGRPARLDQRIGVVSQDALVFSSMLVWENLVFGRRARRQPAFAHDLLVRFGLGGLEDRVAGTLSGGQLQRLALASSLANGPELLLLDEPFGALDAVTRAQLRAHFRTIAANRLSCIFVTHDIDEAIEMTSSRIMIGIGGSAKVASFDPPELSNSDAAYVTVRQRLFSALMGATDVEAGR
jgi:ABC-type nitrate/sulfonate/bicarbonate transport system ATPase subunit